MMNEASGNVERLVPSQILKRFALLFCVKEGKGDLKLMIIVRQLLGQTPGSARHLRCGLRSVIKNHKASGPNCRSKMDVYLVTLSDLL